MKEEKKTSGGKKKSNNYSNHRSNGNKNHTSNANRNNNVKKNYNDNRPKRNEHVDDEAPKVREIKEAVVVNEEDEDKKLIVLIAVAILIIIGTVIGLLVGLNKEGENEENNTNETNITIPVTDNKDVIEDGDEDDNEYVVKTTSSTSENKYQITYYLGDKKVHSTKIKEGAKIRKFTPSGYTNCSYYSDVDLTTKFNFSETASDDTKVYLVCSVKEFTVTYKDTDGSLIKEEQVTGSDTEAYVVANYPEGVSNFYGWSKKANNTVAFKPGQKVYLKGDLTLTAVFGDASVVYENVIVKENSDGSLVKDEAATNAVNNQSSLNEDEIVTDLTAEEPVIVSESDYTGSVEVVLSQDELDNYTLPTTPSSVGLDTPTYFVPTDASDANARLIVSDDTDELTDKQVKLGEVKGRTPDWYTPNVDDNVKEKDYQFVEYDKDSSWKPSTEEENKVEAKWKVQDEDKEAPAEAAPATDSTEPEV